jgi:hypothetical protein
VKERSEPGVHGGFTGNMVSGSGRHTGDVSVTAAVEPAPKPARPTGRAHRVGFVVDVGSYGQRSAPAQEQIQRRLHALLRHVVADVGSDFDEVDHDSGSGDGMVVFLPTCGDPAELLPGLLRSMSCRLAADNEVYRDRMRLRMAVGSGVVGDGRNGFSCPLVVNINRLVDSAPLRRAADEHPDSDLVVLVLDALHKDVVVPGYLPPRSAEFQLVDVTMTESAEPAWLWVGTPHAS